MTTVPTNETSTRSHHKNSARHPIEIDAVVARHSARLEWRAEVPAVRQALDLIGQPGSRRHIPTPAAIVDVDALISNVQRMQGRVDTCGVALWPHAKTHKSAAIAEIQFAAGAVRICVAKVGEAEALAAVAPLPLLVTSPITSLGAIERIVKLAATKIDDLLVVVDHLDQVDALAAQAVRSGVRLGMIIDLDVGLGRTGATNPADAAAIAARIARSPSLELVGVQGYGGHWQHLHGAETRRGKVVKGMARLTSAIQAIVGSGTDVGIRTGGGTGTVAADLELGVLNALQAGSYVFMDGQYLDALGDDEDGRFCCALTISTTVVSANQPRFVTVDAGLKSMATDASTPVPVGLPGSTFKFFGDEHGMISVPAEGPMPRLGDRLELLTPHCDPTIDRYDVLHVVRNDTLIGVIPVDGRGRSQ